ncbi:MAG: DUF3426 domain-containing protein, partial [Desulfobulbales bacterium]
MTVRLTGGVVISTEELESVTSGARKAGLISLVLVATLLLQGLYFLRGPISESLPEARPFFESACARLGCTVPLSQR